MLPILIPPTPRIKHIDFAEARRIMKSTRAVPPLSWIGMATLAPPLRVIKGSTHQQRFAALR